MPEIYLPTNEVISKTINKMTVNPKKFIGSKFAPLEDSYFHEIVYDEKHGGQGMTNAHALDSDPRPITFPKLVKKKFTPAYFKEYHIISESDMTRIQEIGGAKDSRKASLKLVKEMLENLNIRIEVRLEWMRWQALLTGKVIIDENGVKFTAKYGIPTANLNQTVSVVWSDTANSKPLKDLNNTILSFLKSGHDVKSIFMNSNTASLFSLSNDIKTYYMGQSIKEKISPFSIKESFSSLVPGVDLIVYNQHYKDKNGVSQFFIPDNKILFLGDGIIGEIIDVVTVPSVHNKKGQSAPGKFVYPIHKIVEHKNPRIEVLGGIYALPRIRRPEGIKVMDVTVVTP